MVGRAASVVSPWSILYSLVKTYFSLLFSYLAVLRFNLTSALEEEREYQSVNQLQFIHYFTVRYIFLRIIGGSPSSFYWIRFRAPSFSPNGTQTQSVIYLTNASTLHQLRKPIFKNFPPQDISFISKTQNTSVYCIFLRITPPPIDIKRQAFSYFYPKICISFPKNHLFSPFQ